MMALMAGLGEVRLWFEKQSEAGLRPKVIHTSSGGEAYQNAVKIGLGLSTIFSNNFFSCL
jgi:hypothetical protein